MKKKFLLIFNSKLREDTTLESWKITKSYYFCSGIKNNVNTFIMWLRDISRRISNFFQSKILIFLLLKAMRVGGRQKFVLRCGMHLEIVKHRRTKRSSNSETLRNYLKSSLGILWNSKNYENDGNRKKIPCNRKQDKKFPL